MDPQLFKKIRRIQFHTTRLAEDVLAGAYRSAFKGRGMEFEDVREYQAGDEIRTIDWNVTARMNSPYVKRFREEREITMTIAVDISSSTHFGSGNQLKSDLIAEIAATLAFSAIKNNDKVALLLFTNRVEKYFPPNKGTKHILRIIRELLAYKPVETGTNIGKALSFLNKVQTRGGICFLISDFICADFSHEAALIAHKDDLICLALVDRLEEAFPEMGIVTFSDLETKEIRTINTSFPETQQKLVENTHTRLKTIKKLMQKLGGGFCAIHTAKSFIPALHKFFLIRRQMRNK